MIDDLVIVFISAIITAVGFFVVKWMSSIDDTLSSIRDKVDELASHVQILEHDKIPLRQYTDEMNSSKTNLMTVQSRLNEISQKCDSLKAETDKIRVLYNGLHNGRYN